MRLQRPDVVGRSSTGHLKTSVASSSSSSTHRQQQQQQVPLSPRSREYLRLRVNARERQRMHDMNVALDALRRAMPYAQGPAVKKLSKMNTLLLARNYILLLTRTLDELRHLLASSQAMNSTTDVIGCQQETGGVVPGGGQPSRMRGMLAMERQTRLESALRGLIDGREINAEQQRYAEELIRREQLQLRQEQEQVSMTKSSKKNDAVYRCRKQPETSIKGKSQSNLAQPELRKPNRKRKFERDDSPDCPSRRCSPAADDKEVIVASSTDDTAKPPSHVIKCQDERLLQYAMPPVPPPVTSGPLMMMTSSRVPDMATVGFASAAAHQAINSGSSAAAAAAMMSHMISGPFPSCACPHCADSRPTYIMPIDLVTAAAAAAAHYQQQHHHHLSRLS